MKNILLFGILALGISGCSKTWSGIKQDSSELYTDTKEVIHSATAPSYIPPVQSVARPMVSTAPVQQQIATPTVVTPVVSTNPVQVSAATVTMPTVTTPTVSTSSMNVAPATATPTSVVSYVPVKPIAN